MPPSGAVMVPEKRAANGRRLVAPSLADISLARGILLRSWQPSDVHLGNRDLLQPPCRCRPPAAAPVGTPVPVTFRPHRYSLLKVNESGAVQLPDRAAHRSTLGVGRLGYAEDSAGHPVQGNASRFAPLEPAAWVCREVIDDRSLDATMATAHRATLSVRSCCFQIFIKAIAAMLCLGGSQTSPRNGAATLLFPQKSRQYPTPT